MKLGIHQEALRESTSLYQSSCLGSLSQMCHILNLYTYTVLSIF